MLLFQPFLRFWNSYGTTTGARSIAEFQPFLRFWEVAKNIPKWADGDVVIVSTLLEILAVRVAAKQMAVWERSTFQPFLRFWSN